MNRYTQLRNIAWLSLKDNWGKCAAVFACIIALCLGAFIPTWICAIVFDAEWIYVVAAIITYFVVMVLLFSYHNAIFHIARGEQTNILHSMFASLVKNGFSYLLVSLLTVLLCVIVIIPIGVTIMWFLRIATIGMLGVASLLTDSLPTLEQLELMLPLASMPQIYKEGFKVLIVGIIIPLLILVACCALVIYPLLIYCMTLFVKEDNPEMNVFQCMRASRKMMRGNKWTLCKLAFTFIGWVFLCFITCGIAALWVYPYIIATVVAFYEDIKPQEESVIKNPTEQIIEE